MPRVGIDGRHSAGDDDSAAVAAAAAGYSKNGIVFPLYRGAVVTPVVYASFCAVSLKFDAFSACRWQPLPGAARAGAALAAA